MVDPSATARRRSQDDRPLAIAAIALCWVLVARVLLRLGRSPIPVLERWLARVAARLPAPSRGDVELAAGAITAAARRVPGTRCLAWSLALGGLLAQMGVPSRLRFGVARQGPGTIDAHAWIQCQGRDWSWGGDPARGYVALRPPVAAG